MVGRRKKPVCKALMGRFIFVGFVMWSQQHSIVEREDHESASFPISERVRCQDAPPRSSTEGSDHPWCIHVKRHLVVPGAPSCRVIRASGTVHLCSIDCPRKFSHEKKASQRLTELALSSSAKITHGNVNDYV